jgi:hypothetical protein
VKFYLAVVVEGEEEVVVVFPVGAPIRSLLYFSWTKVGANLYFAML